MTRRGIAARAETFGFDTPTPWALDAFRLLFNVPRAFEPLAKAWDLRHPGCLRALQRLVASGFVTYQPAVVVDTRTGRVASTEGRRLTRWRTTASGKRALSAYLEDSRVFEDRHRRVTAGGASAAIALLAAFDLEDAQARHGISAMHAFDRAGMPVRLGRWWMTQFESSGYIVSLPAKIADVREVVPAHWRVTRNLCRQLSDVLDEYGPSHLRTELRLSRTKFLTDIDPARIGITGATDYDHDVETQRVVAAILRSGAWAGSGVFSMEPRIVLPVDQSSIPWGFDLHGGGTSFYQPDAELRGVEQVDGRTVVRRYVVEYERFQSRRDAWGHVERFLGYMHTRALAGEGGVLLFVVDSDARRRSYVQLIEAFADHALDAPHLLPRNPVVLAVSSVQRVLDSVDPLNLREWNRIVLPVGADTHCRPVLHPPESSPYDSYFGRG
jgi:hypothetical protein